MISFGMKFATHFFLINKKDLARGAWLRLITDSSHLVRSSAAECLELFREDEEVCAALLAVYRNDKNTLVRGYAGYSLLAVGASKSEIVELIESSLLKEHYYFVRLQCYHGLYKFCKKDVLDQIIGCYRAQKYGTRCATVNTLREIIEDGVLDETDIIKVSHFVDQHDFKDNPIGLQEYFNDLKRGIEALRR